MIRGLKARAAGTGSDDPRSAPGHFRLLWQPVGDGPVDGRDDSDAIHSRRNDGTSTGVIRVQRQPRHDERHRRQQPAGSAASSSRAAASVGIGRGFLFGGQAPLRRAGVLRPAANRRFRSRTAAAAFIPTTRPVLGVCRPPRLWRFLAGSSPACSGNQRAQRAPPDPAARRS